MKVRGLDSSGDWQFGRGIQSYKTDLDALEQNLTTRIKSWVGNCFFDTTSGVDWNNLLDIGTKTFLDLDIKRIILQTDGVLKISSYESTIDLDSRAVTIVAHVSTIYGDTVYEETV